MSYQEQAMENKSPRLYGIDALRGLTVLSMVAYHFMYDVEVVYGINPDWYRIPAVHIWQQSICWSFILISGFVWSLGREKNLRRGIVINLWGLVITAVTLIALPSEVIWFGVLNFIGCAVLLLIPLHPLLKSAEFHRLRRAAAHTPPSPAEEAEALAGPLSQLSPFSALLQGEQRIPWAGGAVLNQASGGPVYHPAADASGLSLQGLSLQRLLPHAALVFPLPLRLFSPRYFYRPSRLAAAHPPQNTSPQRHRPQSPFDIPSPPAPVHAGVHRDI